MASPGTPPETCRFADLQDGDVLMSLGTSPISQLIARLEEGNYSHAACYVGKGKFVHGTTEGVVEEGVDSLLDTTHFQHVGVFRPKVLVGAVASPVTEAARKLKGQPYDHASLRMVALIVGLQHLRRNLHGLATSIKVIREFLKSQQGGGRTVADFTNEVRQAREGPKSSMTCTEVVTTAFWNGDNRDRKYALEFVTGALWARRLVGIFTFDRPERDAGHKPLIRPEGAYPIDADFQEFLGFSVDTVADGLERTAISAEDVAAVKQMLAGTEFAIANEGVVERALAGDRRGSAKWNAPGALADLIHLLEQYAAPKAVRAGTGYLDLPLNMVSPRDMEQSPSLTFKGRLRA